MAEASEPSDRNDFEVAIICALPIESDAIEATFDKRWETKSSYGKALGDQNIYTTGRISDHNVVLAHMPEMGKRTAASVAASLPSSFPRIRLCLIAGICGAVPRQSAPENQILLGDVIVGTGVVPFDFGKQYSDRFIRKDTPEANPRGLTREIRGFVSRLERDHIRQRLRKSISDHLGSLFSRGVQYPGAREDVLFSSDYRHKHQDPELCAICSQCVSTEDPVCDDALRLSCDELKCDRENGIPRIRLRDRIQPAETNSAQQSTPEIHFGCFASGDVVMKSANHRDEIATKENVIAFEMEAAGVGDSVPALVVKGACDYSDSHKSKQWQKFAAASAAACVKALLTEWRPTDPLPRPQQVPCESTFSF